MVFLTCYPVPHLSEFLFFYIAVSVSFVFQNLTCLLLSMGLPCFPKLDHACPHLNLLFRVAQKQKQKQEFRGPQVL